MVRNQAEWRMGTNNQSNLRVTSISTHLDGQLLELADFLSLDTQRVLHKKHAALVADVLTHSIAINDLGACVYAVR